MKHCSNTYYKKTTNSSGEDVFTYYLFAKCVAYRTNSATSQSWFSKYQPKIKLISSDEEFVREFCSDKIYVLEDLSPHFNGKYISHSKENIFSLCDSYGNILKFFDVNGNEIATDPYSGLTEKQKEFLFKHVDIEDFIFNSKAGNLYYFQHKNGKQTVFFDSSHCYICFTEGEYYYSRADGPSCIQDDGTKTLYEYWVDDKKIFSTKNEIEKDIFNSFLRDKQGKVKQTSSVNIERKRIKYIKEMFSEYKSKLEDSQDLINNLDISEDELKDAQNLINNFDISENKIDDTSNQIIEKPVTSSKFENASYRVAAKQIVNVIKKIILNKFVTKEQDKTFIYEFLNSEYGTAFINLIAGEILRNVSNENNDKLLKLSQEFYTNSIATAEMEFITNIFSGLHHSIEGVLLEKHGKARFNEKNALEEELEVQNHLLQEAL